MNKRAYTIFVLLTGLSLACSLMPLGGTGSSAPDKLCGDGVCDARENAQNCPADCTVPQGKPQEQNKPQQPAASKAEPVLGVVTTTITLNRDMGSGSCGMAPWKPTNCQDIGPTQWWGLQYQASKLQVALIIPDGANRWVITNNAGVVSRYNFPGEGFDMKDGYYQKASVNSSINPECQAQVSGERFGMQVMGSRENNNIQLILSIDPAEQLSGKCGSTAFNFTTHNIQYGGAAAVSGDPMDFTAALSESDLTKEKDIYRHEFKTDTNPSPEKRDHVTTTVEFWCVKKVGEGAYNPTVCPWH